MEDKRRTTPSSTDTEVQSGFNMHDDLFIMIIFVFSWYEYENGLTSTTILKLSSLKAFLLLLTWLAVKQSAEENLLPDCANRQAQ